MKFLLLLMFVMSCAVDVLPEEREKRVDLGEFKDYVDMFKRDAAIYGNGVRIDDLIIRFADISQKNEDRTTLGQCLYGDITPTVEIDPTYWGLMSETGRMLLMYHELGHCVLGRGHYDAEDSIMNSLLLSSIVFKLRRQELLRELFTPMIQLSDHIEIHICDREEH